MSYSDQLTVTGGTSPFTWSVSAGSLPPGVTLNASTGLLSGTPTTAGTYSFTVKVTDSSSQSNTEAVTLTVIPGPSLSFPSPPSGWTNTVYRDTLTESGGTGPFTWSVSSGSLPAGISLSAAGNLTGTPTATGTSSFTVKVTDANGQSATQATGITVSAGVSTTFSAPPAADVGGAYSDTLTATGGTAPYTWSVNAGTLPPGLSLSSGGVLAGTPATAGSYPFTVNVIDANNGIATASITLVVSSGLALSFTAPPNTDVGIGYSDTLTATGGTGPYTWSVSAGSLPAGITLNASTGALAGTATTAGTSSFTIKVTDAVSQSATKAATIVVAARPSLAFPAPPSGQASVAYSDTLTVTGGTGPFAWSVSAGSLPSGLTLNASTGVLSGTPATAGSFAFTVQVSDAFAATATEAVTLVIGSGPLVIAATASPSPAVPGGTVHFTVTVTNTGLSTYTGATFTDPLTDVLDDGSYNGDATATAGTISFTTPNLTWTGNLAPGASATITFSVTVSNPDTGNKILASTVTSATAGSNCASGSTDPRCASTVTVLIPGLTIAVSASTGTTTPGSVVQYTVTVTNSGQTAYAGAAFSDSLSGLLDDVSYNGNVTATAGTAGFTSPNLTWTGNLAVAGTATITFSVTVNNPDTGDKVLAQTVTSATAGSNCAAGSTDARCSGDRGRAGARPDDHADRQPGDDHAGVGGALHGDGDQFGADALYRGHVHRPARRRAGRRRLQRRRHHRHRHRDLHQPGPDLDREPESRGHRDGHVLGDGQQPGYRQPSSGQHGDLRHAREQLRGGEYRPALRGHGGGGPAEYRGVLERGHHHAGFGDRVHRDPGQHREGPLYRDHRGHRPVGGVRQRHLQRRPGRHLRHDHRHRHRRVVDREHPGRRHGHHHRHRDGEQP